MKRMRSAALAGWRGIWRAIFGYSENALARPIRRELYGPKPGLALAVLALACCVVGALVELQFGTSFFLLSDISWPVVVFSGLVALRMRSVLRNSKDLLAEAPGDAGFEALALPLLPAAALLVLMAPLARLAVGLPPTSFDPGQLTGPVAGVAFMADTLRAALGLSAALAIVTATLCYRKEWGSALMDLIMRCFMFGIMINISLMMIGIMSSIMTKVVALVVESIANWVLPSWCLNLMDAVTQDGALALVHLALIGGAWSAAREGFTPLMETGDVDLMTVLSERLTGSEEKKEAKKERKKRRKAEETEQELADTLAAAAAAAAAVEDQTEK